VKAVREKLDAVLPVAEYEKCVALAATVKVEEKPVDVEPMEEKIG
jgi:hypothetical protein